MTLITFIEYLGLLKNQGIDFHLYHKQIQAIKADLDGIATDLLIVTASKLLGKNYKPFQYKTAGQDIGLSKEEIELIAAATLGNKQESIVRKWIIETTGATLHKSSLY